jgi:hypothetical protein
MSALTEVNSSVRFFWNNKRGKIAMLIFPEPDMFLPHSIETE